MKKYSVNYTKSNNNFIIANMPHKEIKEDDLKYLPTIKVIKNIISRGLPTKPSKYLQKKYPLTEEECFLISTEKPIWKDTIKGSSNSIYNPAYTFFYEILDKYLEEYSFIKNLIIPEENIETIEQKEIKELKNEKVDFYLPQAHLVIEIDGIQHENTKEKDSLRDSIQSSKVIRITTKSINDKDKYFLDKIEEIRSNLKENQIINNYKNQLSKKYSENKLALITISRLQILILELLLTGNLSLSDKEWNLKVLNIKEGLIIDAYQDLINYLDNLLKLQNINISIPKLNLNKENSIIIDMDILKRYTDEYKYQKNIIYIRNDYYENDRNYFELETDSKINYNINEKNQEQIKILEWFIYNVFGFKTFKQGQIEIIANVLNLKDTIGILPTGTGKSLCYQLASLLQPGATFIICPLTSLMKDAQDNMIKIGITNTTKISYDLDEQQKEFALDNIMKGKSLMSWITPERFQLISFRNSLSALASKKNISYMIIDEVHCMSEWGHDFRISYLQLIKTIKKYVPDPTILGLTATASNQVLKDIMIQFEIPINDYTNVKSSNNFIRKELEFSVYNLEEFQKQNKLNELINYIINLENKISAPFSGIIFTPFAGGDRGAFNQSILAQKKYPQIKDKISYFSGKLAKQVNLTYEEFIRHKIKVQEEFKTNKIHHLFATKSFGMGFDKPDIRYTIHYGCPSSLEAFYQEAGRAGRDGKKARCIVIHGKNQISEEETIELLQNFQKIDYIPDCWGKGDIWDQITLFKKNKKSLIEEVENIYKIFLQLSPLQEKEFPYSNIESEKEILEQTIYKLSLLGVIEDWIINYKENIIVKCNDYTEETIKLSLEKYLQKYDEYFSFTDLKEKYNQYRKVLLKDIPTIKKYIEILCSWYNEEINYRHLTSIKYFDELMTNFKNTEELNQVIKNYFSYTDNTLFLRQMENISDTYEEVFAILHQNRNIDNAFISNKEQQNLQITLSSLLVENRNHTSYNLLSGILRLMLDNFDYLDGETRLKDALDIITKENNLNQKVFLEQLLSIETVLTEKNKKILATILKDYYEDFEKLHMIYTKIPLKSIKNKIIKIELGKIIEIERKIIHE